LAALILRVGSGGSKLEAAAGLRLMNETLKRLSEIETGGLPVLSVYLDVRPEATGESPRTRAGLVVLKDRLNEIRKTFLPRGEGLDSLDTDTRRIWAFVEGEMKPSTKGLAIFACAARDVLEIVEVGVPFENQVVAGSRPDLFQFAKLAEEYETSLVAVVDTNTARLFVYRHGRLEEVGGPDDHSVHFRKRATGGWSQARYQRHIDKHIRDFATEVAGVLADVSDKEQAQHIILAGDEVVMTALQGELSKATAEKVRDIVRLDIRAGRDEVAEAVEPLLRELEAEAARSLVERLVGEVRRGGLGVAGVKRTSRALRLGQVDILIIDGTARISARTRSELVRRAAATGASTEVVDRNEALLRLGGVGALLRFRA
jgi:peptide chain release factor subunit 1